MINTLTTARALTAQLCELLNKATTARHRKPGTVL
jgi:hypothetical protein